MPLIKALRIPPRTNGIRRPVYRGMADSASYTDCRERATPQRSRGTRANEHVAASKPRGGTARRISENILRISRARWDRRPVRLETRWPGRADVAWGRNLADLVGLGPVILKISPAGPGARAGPGAVGSARLDPTSESWPHPQKTVGFEMLDFLQFENITKRDVKRDTSAISLGVKCHQS